MLYANFIEVKKGHTNLLVDVRIEFNKKEICKLDLAYLDQKVSITLKKGKIVRYIVNGINFELQDYSVLFLGRELLPEIIFEKNEPIDIRRFFDETICQCKPIIDILQKKVGSKASLKSIEKFVGEILFIQTRDELLEKLKNCKRSEIVRSYFGLVDKENTTVNEINNHMQVVLIPHIIRRINQELNDFFDNLFYIKPIRANANRYYRIQGIGVKNVDPDGSNLPMILYNLSTERQKEFASWCKKQFGISFSVKEIGGHISLMVNTEGDYEINIADSGYGYSQVLPIILQIWLLIEKNSGLKNKDYKANYTIIIEQPELHLHPAFQARLAEIFVSFINIIKKSNSKVNIVFETHSDILINKLGTLVAENKIDEEDINIVLVEKINAVSTFKQVSYNDSGLINEWPIGFMSSEA